MVSRVGPHSDYCWRLVDHKIKSIAILPTTGCDYSLCSSHSAIHLSQRFQEKLHCRIHSKVSLFPLFSLMRFLTAPPPSKIESDATTLRNNSSSCKKCEQHHSLSSPPTRLVFLTKPESAIFSKLRFRWRHGQIPDRLLEWNPFEDSDLYYQCSPAAECLPFRAHLFSGEWQEGQRYGLLC
jgi:hypothetical protein